MIYDVLQIPGEVLVQIWLLAHAAWQDFLNFQDRKNGKEFTEGAHITARAVSTARAISKGEELDWPSQIPKFHEEREGAEAKAVREIYAMACAWAILHEMQHAKFDKDVNRPKDCIAEEAACDAYANEFLFSKIEKYSELTQEAPDRVRDKRAIAAFVGLYFVAKISDGRESETHPPIGDRIKSLFDRIGEAPLNHFWDVALALICELKPEITKKKIEVENPTSRDLAYIALNYAFG